MMNLRTLVLGVALLSAGIWMGPGWAAEGATQAAAQPAATGVEKAEAQIAVALAYDAEGKYLEARAEYEKALAIEGISPEQTGRTLVKLAAGYCREYKWQPANIALEKVVALEGASNASKFEADMMIGDIFVKYGGEWGWGKTRVALERALTVPDISLEQKAAAQKALLPALAFFGEHGKARAVLNELAVNETLTPPARLAAQLSLGKACLLDKDYAAARDELAKALAMPGVTDAMKADIQLHVGLSYYEAKDYESAKPELMKVLEMPGAGVRPPSDGGRSNYIPAREAMLRLRLRDLIPDDKKFLKVMFIGSSHTGREDVPNLVMQLAASAPADQPRIIAGDYVRMGTKIDSFWNEGDGNSTPRGMIAAEPWDAVVFETFYTMKSDDLLKYGTLFADLIRSKNAKAVIYESPIAQASAYPAEYQKFHDDNVAVGRALKIPVAPSVAAWMRYLGPKPTAEQFGAVYADWIHATPKGAYMTACCIYSALTGRSPVGLAHAGIPDAEATALQEAAWGAYQETNGL